MNALPRTLFMILLGSLLLLQTACGPKAQHPMNVSGTAIQKLQAFKAQPKFDPNAMYTGAWPAEVRPVLNAVLNQSADDFLAIAESSPTRERYLQAMSAGLARIEPDELDTEDRERVAEQYQNLMDIVGLQSSNGLLNTFVYGSLLGGMLSSDKDSVE
jgi:hypothetical protein